MHLRTLDLDRVPSGAYARFRRVLDRAERERADAFARAEDRLAYAAAHALARALLARLTGRAPDALVLHRAPEGKPFLDPAMNPRAIRYSLSHAPGCVAVAAAAGREVGVDVEASERDVPVRALARRFFSAREAAEIDALGDAAARARFFTLWTVKEAVAKATGRGLRVPLAAIGAQPPGWRVRTFRPTRRHHAALALAGAPGGQLTETGC